MHILIIGLGGFCGALTRYFFYRLEHTYSQLNFPIATIIVNLLGCLLMGMLFAHISKNNPPTSQWSLFLGVGFLGSLTTFSTFSLDNYGLILKGLWPQVFINITLHVFAGLLAIALGVALAAKLKSTL